jgi:hypothetical protein
MRDDVRETNFFAENLFEQEEVHRDRFIPYFERWLYVVGGVVMFLRVLKLLLSNAVVFSLVVVCWRLHWVVFRAVCSGIVFDFGFCL